MPAPYTYQSGFEVLLVARLIQTLFLSSLDCSLFSHTVTKLDFLVVPNTKAGQVAIVPGLAHGLWFSLQRLARIIFAAGNKYSPIRHEGPLPLTIPQIAFDQLGLAPPGVLATLVYPERNPLLFIQDIAAQRVAITTIQFVGQKTIRWIIDAIIRSAEVQWGCYWDWSGVLELKGCPPQDFGIFRAQVIEEIEKMRTGSLSEDLFIQDSSDEDTEKLVDSCGWPPDPPTTPIESNAIAELREVVEAVRVTFPALDVHYVPLPPCSYEMQDINNMANLLDRLELTDIVGLDMRNFQ